MSESRLLQITYRVERGRITGKTEPSHLTPPQRQNLPRTEDESEQQRISSSLQLDPFPPTTRLASRSNSLLHGRGKRVQKILL